MADGGEENINNDTKEREREVVNETQLHAKGSSLGHCPTKVTSGLDMVIPHSRHRHLRVRERAPFYPSFFLSLSLFLLPPSNLRIPAVISKTHHYISCFGRPTVSH